MLPNETTCVGACNGFNGGADARSPEPTRVPIVGTENLTFGAFGSALGESCVTFVSQAGLKNAERLALSKQVLPVMNTRKIGKHSMILNSATPRMEVNPETYEVRADGRLLTCEPAKALSMAQRYFMY